MTDPDLDGANATAEAGPGQNVGARDFVDDQVSQNPRLLKRIPLAGWVEKFTWWSTAMISLVPGLPLPQYRHSSDTDNVYPYYFTNVVPPGQGVRVYLLDTGLNMQHPEFDGRLRSGVTQGQTQTDWDIDWLFPQVDPNEWYHGTNSRGLPQYTFGPLGSNANFPLFTVRSALGLIKQEILNRRAQGETLIRDIIFARLSFWIRSGRNFRRI